MKSPMDYVTGMSLTFEQANLDYSCHYIKLMKTVGDQSTESLLKKVYEDEIGHVKYGVAWFDVWRSEKDSQWQAHQNTMKGREPLSMSRAKGIGFDRDGRLKAGLSLDYVDRMEVFGNPKGSPPSLFWYNADFELELGHQSSGYSPSKGVKLLMSDFEVLPMYLAKSGDAVLCQNLPELRYQKYIKDRLGKVLEFVPWSGAERDLLDLGVSQCFSSLKPGVGVLELVSLSPLWR